MSTFVTRSQDYYARLFNYVQNAAEASREVLLQPQKHGAPTRFGRGVW